jgi:uncharacterized membrane protein YidH (DUF202 family)
MAGSLLIYGQASPLMSGRLHTSPAAYERRRGPDIAQPGAWSPGGPREEIEVKLLGVALIVLGLAGLLYGGFSWTRKEKVIDAGPIQVTADKRESLPVSPIVGGLLLVAGVVLVIRKS